MFCFTNSANITAFTKLDMNITIAFYNNTLDGLLLHIYEAITMQEAE